MSNHHDNLSSDNLENDDTFLELLSFDGFLNDELQKSVFVLVCEYVHTQNKH